MGLPWASVAMDTTGSDTTPPTVVFKFPAADASLLGAVTHVELQFNEPIVGITPSMLTVDGSQATTITNGGGAGPYMFSGFTPVTAAGAVNISLTGAVIVDAGDNAFSARAIRVWPARLWRAARVIPRVRPSFSSTRSPWNPAWTTTT